MVCMSITHRGEVLLGVEASGEHEREEVDEQMGVLPHDVVAIAAEALEACEVLMRLPVRATDHVAIHTTCTPGAGWGHRVGEGRAARAI
jgi:hypothetical protein